MNRLDLNQINSFVDSEIQGPVEPMNYDNIQMDPSATFYPSKSADLDAEFGDASQLSDIKSQPMPFQTNSQRYNRLESNSFASSQGGVNLQIE